MKRGIKRNRKQLLHLSRSFVLTVSADSDLLLFLSVCEPLPCGADGGGWYENEQLGRGREGERVHY